MFEATGGVNTHKGMIFSLGIIAASIDTAVPPRFPPGIFFSEEPDQLLSFCKEAVYPYLRQDFEQMKGRPPQTHGERLFAATASGGIRGEAMDGFPSLSQSCPPGE